MRFVRSAWVVSGLALLAAGGALGQEVSPELSEADLQLRVYQPSMADPAELLGRARQLFGRPFLVRETGRQVTAEEAVFLVGRQIHVYETRERADRILEALRTMDVGESHVARVYAPRFVPGDVLLELLGPFRRDVPVSPTRGAAVTPNVSLSEGSGRIVLWDVQSQVEAMWKVLEESDAATHKAQLVIFVVQAVPPPELDFRRETDRDLVVPPTPLPPDLELAMRAMLRYKMDFDLLGIASTAITLDSRREVSLDMDLSVSGHCKVSFRPGAYDPESKTLVFEDFDFRHDLFEVQTFATSPWLRVGQFEVVGSVGKPPVFLVMRLVLDER